MRGNPRVWLLRRLDEALRARERGLRGDALRRFRVVMGATSLVLLLDLIYLGVIFRLPPSRQASQALAVGLGLLLGGGSLVLVRRGRSSQTPALLLCGSLSAGIILATLAVEQPGAVVHAANMLAPALAVYLLGARPGFAFTALHVFHAGFLHEFVHSGFGLTRPLFSHPETWWGNFMGCVALVLGWALSWLHSTASEEARRELEHALRTLRESEGKLLSLFESSDDAVLSVDARLCLVMANTTAQGLFREVTGGALRPGSSVPDQCPPPLRAWVKELSTQALTGQRMRGEVDVEIQGARRTVDVIFTPVWEGERVVGLTLFSRDITERKRAETKLGEMHRSLLDVSRQAGMAEIATGVLHNVGNTLNSVNVSVNLVVERLRATRAAGLERCVALLRENASRLCAFFTEDPRGQQLPSYLEALALQLSQERATVMEEMRRLSESVDHIKSVVSMQQRHARISGVLEHVAVPSLIDDALRLHAVSFERLGIVLKRDYASAVPTVLVDRHKLLQILVNLLSNARHALLERTGEDRQLTLKVARAGARLNISVSDNGVGIAPETLHRLFTQGFTTKRDGHGFGLHISALAAREMGGQLSGASEGRSHGATFTLELPLVAPDMSGPRA
ncbi:ATP-binding protein [Melittangium boletus]|uniref:ATP-binding protein n=1 Tax=Melittangium boletus TaxID=83453 RepID=UPI003DA5DFA4